MKKIIIHIVLIAASLWLAYECYRSIAVVEEFQKIKDHRYEAVIQRLKDIRTAQEAYLDVYGRYTSSFDTLIYFVKHDSLKVVNAIGELTDDMVDEGLTEADAVKRGLIIRDTVRVAAYESLFGKGYPIDDLRYVPFTNRKHEFLMGTNQVWNSDASIQTPVFEARVNNMIIFEDIADEYWDELLQENGERKRLSKYPGLKVGDLKEANNNVGNWE